MQPATWSVSLALKWPRVSHCIYYSRHALALTARINKCSDQERILTSRLRCCCGCQMHSIALTVTKHALCPCSSSLSRDVTFCCSKERPVWNGCALIFNDYAIIREFWLRFFVCIYFGLTFGSANSFVLLCCHFLEIFSLYGLLAKNSINLQRAAVRVADRNFAKCVPLCLGCLTARNLLLHQKTMST